MRTWLPVFRAFNRPYCPPRTKLAQLPVPVQFRFYSDMPKDKDKGTTLKNPKGTRDWSGSDVGLLEDIFAQISRVIRRHAGKKLDTPVFELQEVLKSKYGEDSKLIYDLADQGGELLSLRYDLTVPFARWLAMNPNVKNYKRFAIGKVYRRDQPAIAKGRMREFYQCDIDFAGASDPMIADSEIIAIISEVFESLQWQGRYTIKVNDRRILDGLFEVCGVPPEKLRTISSAVDKLDKLPWSEVKKEMVEQKGLDEAVADKIQTYVTRKGGRDLLESLQNDASLMANAKAKLGIDEMSLLFTYLESWNCQDKISFDLSLARGLDYYTGVIYEVITEGSAPSSMPNPTSQVANGTSSLPAQTTKPSSKPPKFTKTTDEGDEDRSSDPSIGVGSVAAGGRYDTLVERFRPGADVPCVGVSFGVDRIFSITKTLLSQGKTFNYITSSNPDVYVMAFGSGMTAERIRVSRTLLEAGVKSEFMYKVKPKPQAQFKNAETAGAKWGIILGEEEWKNGQVRIKEMGLPDGHPEKDGVLTKIEDVGREVAKRVGRSSSIEGQLEGLRVGDGTGPEGAELARTVALDQS